jgi:hypothetical protein
MLAGDLTTFSSLLAEVAPLQDGEGLTSLEAQQVSLLLYVSHDSSFLRKIKEYSVNLVENTTCRLRRK